MKGLLFISMLLAMIYVVYLQMQQVKEHDIDKVETEVDKTREQLNQSLEQHRESIERNLPE